MRYLVIHLLFLLLAVGLNYQTIQYGLSYREGKASYAETLNYRQRLLDPQEWLNKDVIRAKMATMEAEAERLAEVKRKGMQYFYLHLLLILLYLGSLYAFYRKDKNRMLLVITLITAALACLPSGLLSPMLEIGAAEHNLDIGEIPISARVLGMNVQVEVRQAFEGDMYFYYQSKSVVELIQLLFRQHNWLVGSAILLFSVLFPLGKIISTYYMALRPASGNRSLSFFVEKSGKWSMADVFVVAVFLAYLAFSNIQSGIQTESNTLPGLYFFLSYCLLSIMASTFFASAKNKAKQH
jgi:hypothetical protein